MATPGVTGAVVWDSGVVLAKFLEHAADSQQLLLRRASGRPRIRMRPGGVRRRGSGSRSLYGAMILTMNWFGSHCPISAGPRNAFFDALFKAVGSINIIAEDLGVITKDVVQLRKSIGAPGMAVLQFGS
ncbi:hypothetical protein GQ55_9G513900 [Panicum hallii var. hallii]|uniref:4-alpha-glucanotransferase n=1 Tax=Panicum hallii var. hallii TaxID=1504633 RepID=A0A2T7CDZ1_9POAL|nr:hypothetical protein GQ55_9G513900 [Panicum hallii var. hallii]